MTAPVAFIDTETMGLDPDKHPIWELALIVDDREYCWLFDADPMIGDEMALKIGRFHERHWKGNRYVGPRGTGIVTTAFADHDVSVLDATHQRPQTALDVLRFVAAITHGRHLVGAVPSFDEERLRRFMRRNEVVPSWHYHLIDVETLAVGALVKFAQDLDEGHRGGSGTSGEIERLCTVATPPWNSDELAKAVGVLPDRYDRHTALGDARWAKAIYEAVMGFASQVAHAE